MILLCLLTVAVTLIADVSSGGPCYGDLGCFSTSYPWTSISHPCPAPQSPEAIATKVFFARRSNNKNLFNVSIWPNIDISNIDFCNTCPTIFVFHGYFEYADKAWVIEMKQNLLYREDANVFLIDWSAGANSINYFQAVSNTRVVAAQVARLIRFLERETGLPLVKVYLIGHSLGAQLASYVGHALGGNIGRITGLDPAGPSFENTPPLVRLDPTDARFVDVVHTNGVRVGLAFGYADPCGHVDLYMNGGAYQPGCLVPKTHPDISLNDLATNSAEEIMHSLGSYVFCSHQKSVKFFNGALFGPCKIWGYKVDEHDLLLDQLIPDIAVPLQTEHRHCTAETCTVLGYDTIKYDARGLFASETTQQSPYCDTHISRNYDTEKQEEIDNRL